MKTRPHTAAFAALMASIAPAGAYTFDYAAPVLAQATQTAPLSSYAMPIGPFANNTMQTRSVEGAVDSHAVRLDAPGATTLQLLSPLRAQLAAAGYTVVYECAAFECGGFDFRYGTEVLAEPDMHVDLGDYRYLAATRPGDLGVISLLVSRSAQAGYVQVVAVTPGSMEPELTASSKSPEGDQGALAAETTDSKLAADAAALPAPAPREVRVLDDLVFASGSAQLSVGDYPSIKDLAAALRANPAAAVTLLGHTDATGPLDANIAISQKRADAVKAALMAKGIAPNRIVAKGMGPKSPRAANDTAEGRRQNRRVEAMIMAVANDP